MRVLTLIFTSLVTAALHAAPLAPLPLWPTGAPGALGDKDDDKPTLTAFLPTPEKATGAAIMICPGGGYGMGLGGDRSGGEHHPWAADCLFWLKAQGFAK